MQNNKSDVRYTKEREIRFKTDSIIMQKRLKRKTLKYPDDLREVQKEKIKVKSKLENVKEIKNRIFELEKQYEKTKEEYFRKAGIPSDK